MATSLSLSGALRQFRTASSALRQVIVRETFFSGKMRLITVLGGGILGLGITYAATKITISLASSFFARKKPPHRKENKPNPSFRTNILSSSTSSPCLPNRHIAIDCFSKVIDQFIQDHTHRFEKWGLSHSASIKELELIFLQRSPEEDKNHDHLSKSLEDWAQRHHFNSEAVQPIIIQWKEQNNQSINTLKSTLKAFAAKHSTEVRDLKNTLKTVSTWSFIKYYESEAVKYIEYWSDPYTYYEKVIQSYNLDIALEMRLIACFKGNNLNEFRNEVDSSGIPPKTQGSLLALSAYIKEAHKIHFDPQDPEELEKSFALKMRNIVTTGNTAYSIFNAILTFLTPEKQETPLPLQPAESLKKNGDEAIAAMFNTITNTVTTKYFQPLIEKMQREARINEPLPAVKPIVHWLLNLIAPYATTTITKLEKFLAHLSMTRITLTLHCVASEILGCCLAMKQATGDHGNPMNNSWVMPKTQDDPQAQRLAALNIENSDALQILYYSAKYTSGANASDVLKNLNSKYANVIGDQESEKQQIGESAKKLQQAFPTLEPLIEDPQLTDSNTLFALLASQITSSTQEASLFSHATILGIPHLVKNRVPEIAQRILDKISSTGFISTSITKLLITSSLTLTTDNQTWNELLPFLQLVYSSMTEEDQKYITTHLSYLYSGELLETRTKALQTEIPQDKIPPIYNTLQDILDEEIKLSGYLAMLKPHIDDDKIQEMHKDLTRQLELKQFEKAKALVLFYVNEKLSSALSFDPTGCLTQVITKIVEGAFDLLQYQAIVKHLIFTAIDFLCKEPENIKNVQNGHIPSMFEILEAHKLNESLESKALEVAQAYNNDWSASALLANGAAGILKLAGYKIWTPLKTNFNDNLRLTSENFAHLVTKQITDAGKDPSSLSAVIIGAMTEFVFDPRAENPPR